VYSQRLINLSGKIKTLFLLLVSISFLQENYIKRKKKESLDLKQKVNL